MGDFSFTENLKIVECANCHMNFAITEKFQKDRLKDHEDFYCPSGHSNVYRGQSEEEKLRQERDRLKQNQAYLQDQIRSEQDKKNAARHQTRAYKGVVTRIKNRVGNGVCPCCNRTFKNLHDHMHSQHPDYKQGEENEKSEKDRHSQSASKSGQRRRAGNA